MLLLNSLISLVGVRRDHTGRPLFQCCCICAGEHACNSDSVPTNSVCVVAHDGEQGRVLHLPARIGTLLASSPIGIPIRSSTRRVSASFPTNPNIHVLLYKIITNHHFVLSLLGSLNLSSVLLIYFILIPSSQLGIPFVPAPRKSELGSLVRIKFRAG